VRLLIGRRQWLGSLGLVLGIVFLGAGPSGAGILDAFWTAPTTNADGSPLTDLASYRVYYGTSSAPCPGSSFFQVASTTPSPPAGLAVTFRLTGLSAGALYYVSVTAVDTSNNESACPTPVSAAARIEFAVSPTGTVNFGTVNLGGFAEQTFTVQNSVGGIVSGAAASSPPFSIVSGSPFSLVGVGATQAVTVRFSPTTSATVSSNVNFAAHGDTISRLVAGTGGVPDTTPPIVVVTSPTPSSTYTTSSSLLTLGGTASDNVGVTQVTWTNSAGGNGTATGATSWTASGISLQVGTNTLTVTARDAAGNAGMVSLAATLVAFTFTDNPLTVRSTVIKAVHVMELRAAIDSVRVARGLAKFAWTDQTLTSGSTPVESVHLIELRTALNEAYQAAGWTPPAYTDPAAEAGRTVIRAIHLNELRAAVRAIQ